MAAVLDTSPAVDRGTFIGGTDAAVVMGLSPYQTPAGMWLAKTGRGDPEVISEPRRRRLELGKRLEPVIVDLALERLREDGHDVALIARNRRYRHSRHKFLSCELDAELMVDGEEVNFDAKSVNGRMAGEWGREGSDEVPLHYAAQFMHGLGITGRKRCIAAAMIGLDDVRLYSTPRDDVTVKAMQTACVAWWRLHIVKDQQPPATTLGDVRRLYPVDDGTPIEATEAVLADVERLRHVIAQRKALTDEEETLRFNIARYVANAKFLTLNARPIATWSTHEVGYFDEAAFRRHYSDLHALFSTTRKQRTLRLR